MNEEIVKALSQVTVRLFPFHAWVPNKEQGTISLVDVRGQRGIRGRITVAPSDYYDALICEAIIEPRSRVNCEPVRFRVDNIHSGMDLIEQLMRLTKSYNFDHYLEPFTTPFVIPSDGLQENVVYIYGDTKEEVRNLFLESYTQMMFDGDSIDSVILESQAKKGITLDAYRKKPKWEVYYTYRRQSKMISDINVRSTAPQKLYRVAQNNPAQIITDWAAQGFGTGTGNTISISSTPVTEGDFATFTGEPLPDDPTNSF